MGLGSKKNGSLEEVDGRSVFGSASTQAVSRGVGLFSGTIQFRRVIDEAQ